MCCCLDYDTELVTIIQNTKGSCGKIFDQFFTTKSEGSGLGLPVIHSILKKHNGKVTVQSELGNFSEFTVLLPASKNLPREKN